MALRTERLVLDQPTERDVPLITEYCQDPLFERYMATPWPYEERHARSLVTEAVPSEWAADRSFTWAIRLAAGGPLIGMIGHRSALADVGFWLGAPHRGHGYMTEAVGAVVDWVFDRGAELVAWECVVGNLASASVARKAGFRFLGEGPAHVTGRDGSRPASWHGELRPGEAREPKPGWPA
ncbi:MAG: GNAT family N-acetyltransferase [Actinomycetota bacterium]|nr:GNAT family N-acetyltransferase [Actinomycetota bacterium]